MRICLTYAPWLLSHRGGTLGLDDYRNDKRGLSGSEMCAVRLYEELQAMGHTVSCCWDGAESYGQRLAAEFDIAIAVNCPDDLRGMKAKFKVCYALLNDWTFAKAGFEDHVDLFASPSAPHLEQVLHNPAWRAVEKLPDFPNGKAQYEPDANKWVTVALGCDPANYEGVAKVPGRVLYCSSPDRGLHHLLQEWSRIKRAVPHASLHIGYNPERWFRSWDGTPYCPHIPGIEEQRQRALYCEEALRRLKDWDVTVLGDCSRNKIDREMAEAQCLAFPMDTTSWSEGFSCTTLEACAARACPITTDADAFRGLYGDVLPLTERAGDWVPKWRDNVIRALTDEGWREQVNDRAEAFAREKTWKRTAERLMAEIQART